MQINSINTASFGKVYISDNYNARKELIKEIARSNAPAEVYKEALIDMIATEKDYKTVLMVTKNSADDEIKMHVHDDANGVSHTSYGNTRFMRLLKLTRKDELKQFLSNLRYGIEK